MKNGKHSIRAKHFDMPTEPKEKSKFSKIVFKILILFIIIIFLYFVYDIYLKNWSFPTLDDDIEANKKEEEIYEIIGKIGVQTSLPVEGAEYLEITGVYIDVDDSGRSKISAKLKNNSDESYESVDLRLNLLDENNNEILFFDFKINRIDANSVAATYATLKQDLSDCVNYSIVLKKSKE